MKEDKLVSVYINVYNRADLVGETIRSVLSQTYANLQIIIVDDGSTDGTADVIRSFEDPRIEFYPLEKNVNVVGALNEGLKHVRGEYAAHVDSDDLWEPDKIEKQVAFLETHAEYGSCFSLVKIIDETGAEAAGNEVLNSALFQVDNMPQAKMLRFFYEHSNHLNHSSMLVRKEILDQSGGYDLALQYLHDFDLWTKFILAAPIYILQEPLVCYRVHSGNYSGSDEGRDNAYQWEFASVMRAMIDACPQDLFAQAFEDKRKCELPLTPQRLKIEKAFVLLDAFTVNNSNPVLGLERLDALFAMPEYREIMEQDFGFTREELYQLHRENVYFNADKTQYLHDQITYLTGNVKALEDAAANKDQQIEELKAEIGSQSKLAKGLRKISSIRSRKLKNGAKAKKKLMLYGFYGHNLGDDMFFDMLLTRYPDVLFAVCDSSAYAAFFAKYNNVRLYASDSGFAIKLNRLGEKFGIRNLYETIVRSSTDGGVHFGGSIYQQIGNWEQDLKDREKRKQKGKSFFGISNNFGPYHTEDYKEFWRKQFVTWNDVCFRDRYSFDLFSDIASVRYAPDALFAYEGKPADALFACERKPADAAIYGTEPQTEENRKKRLAISLIDLRWELRGIAPEICDAYEAFLCRTIEEALAGDYEIILLSFCEMQRDGAAAQKIRDHFCQLNPKAAERIRIEIYYDQIAPMIQTIAACDLILATRFHAMVLGYVFGKRVLPVCYSDKMVNVLEDLALAKQFADIRKPSTYPEGPVLEAFAQADSEKIEKIRAQAADQFLRLDQYLS